MNASAVVLLVLAIVIVWGGVIVSILYLRSRPDVTTWPLGGDDDHREDDAPVQRDT
jgi:hypothetical protein